MNSSTAKLTIREIKGSLGRYLAIFAIIALGAGLFMGLRMSKPDFMATFNAYASDSDFYDYRLVSTLGLTQEDLDEVQKLDGVTGAEGVVTADFLFNSEEEDNLIMVAQTIPEKINLIHLCAGEMPQSGNECLADPEMYSEKDIGTVIRLSSDNSDTTKDMFAYDEYKIVGLTDSVIYINYERGSSTLGNGSVKGYVFIPAEGFSTDFFTDIYLTVDCDEYIYSDEYYDKIEPYRHTLEHFMEERADIRRNGIIDDANAELEEARSQYEDGLRQYESAKSEYDRGVEEFNTRKAETEKQLADAKKQIDDAEAMMQNASLLDEKQAEIDAGKTQLDAGYAEYQKGLSEFESKSRLAYLTVNAQISRYTDTINGKEASNAELAAEIEELNAELAAAQAEGKNLRVSIIEAEISLRQSRIEDNQKTIERAQSNLAEQEQKKAEIDAELQPCVDQLAAAKAELDAGYAQLEAGQQEIDNARNMIENGARQLEQGKIDYENGKEKAEAAFAEGEAELKDGKAQLDAAKAELDEGKKQLDDAEKQIKNIEHADTYVLDRDTNIGYVCFKSDTEIVNSIAGVFPVFFFLVAALVCLTTMTRMIDDQRTQVGIMKALGYSAPAIMSKYMFYSGSATLLGGAIGIAAGSIAFPALIWFGYGLLYNIPGIVFTMNWPLAAILLFANLAVMLAVTGLCCGRELRSAPSELIRPKAPEAGKRILLERVKPVWNRLSFMQKVSIRNVLRYKKRIFMIVLGVGGCTALVLTAFGLNDTIKHVVSAQYDEICVYDYELSLAYNMTAEEQDIFLAESGDNVGSAMFMYRGIADVSCGGDTKSVNLTATDAKDISDFIDLHDGKNRIGYPGTDEAIINKNLGRILEVSVGDTLTVTNADMDEMTVTVVGMFDSYISHDVFVSLDTCTKQWGYTPELKAAFICAPEGEDIYAVSENLAEVDGVRNLKLIADDKDRINNMLEGLNFIIAAIILCAGLLAFIVLYNLTNINISERIREIATIKVLGFYPKEAADYVFRENMALTAMGAVFGLGLGVVFHAFVMSKIKVDMMYMEPQINLLSYVLAIALTFIFAVIVNTIMRRRIDNIDMAGALKSIE